MLSCLLKVMRRSLGLWLVLATLLAFAGSVFADGDGGGGPGDPDGDTPQPPQPRPYSAELV